jgi:hypothetical protein
MNMITRYIPVASLTAAAALSLMFLSNPASAQQAAPEKQPAQQGQTGSQGAPAAVSDQKVEAFAVAYLQVDKVRQEYSAKIGATQDTAAKQQLQTEASKQMVQAVEASPISLDEYNSILTAAQNDPALVKRVQEKLQESAPAQQPAATQQ